MKQARRYEPLELPALLNTPWRRTRSPSVQHGRVSVHDLGPNVMGPRLRRIAGRRSVTRFVAMVLFCLFVWFASSITIAFTMKRILDSDGFPGFHFPFFLCFCTNAGSSLLALLTVHLKPALRQPPMPRRTFYRVAVPTGLASMCDFGFSNWSLMYLPVSVWTVFKAMGPLTVLLFSLALRVERPSIRTPIAILLVCGGLCLVSFDRLDLPEQPLGIGLGLIAVSFTGLRWALTQLLMVGQVAQPDGAAGRLPPKRADPLSTMIHTMPVVAGGAFVCVLAIERDLFATFGAYAASGALLSLLLLIGMMVVLVFALQLAEFKLVQLTSGLTVSVFSVFKEVLTVFIAVAGGDQLSPLNMVGVGLALFGNLLYFMKRTGERRGGEEPGAGPRAEPGGPTASSSSSSSSRSSSPPESQASSVQPFY